ncbi:hypothetical protein B2J93_3961 [Marssonina coronariae]|uniref:Uncharacterized protein n=1 Tax=Diplocarpon coronariae TaxID=2795749 RepID=A0A218YX71_9HELO|nr:hypothetical protein B2J93_3961 [Marssonina coronariae]
MFTWSQPYLKTQAWVDEGRDTDGRPLPLLIEIEKINLRSG